MPILGNGQTTGGLGQVVLDVVAVTVGARTQIDPAVRIYTADHPRDPSVRHTSAEFGRLSGSVKMCGLAAAR